jgi:hypothetical protein
MFVSQVSSLKGVAPKPASDFERNEYKMKINVKENTESSSSLAKTCMRKDSESKPGFSLDNSSDLLAAKTLFSQVYLALKEKKEGFGKDDLNKLRAKVYGDAIRHFNNAMTMLLESVNTPAMNIKGDKLGKNPIEKLAGSVRSLTITDNNRKDLFTVLFTVGDDNKVSNVSVVPAESDKKK